MQAVDRGDVRNKVEPRDAVHRMIKEMARRAEVIRKDARREKIADEFGRLNVLREIQIVEIVGIEVAFVRSSIGDQKKQHDGCKQERRQPEAGKRGADHELSMIRGMPRVTL